MSLIAGGADGAVGPRRGADYSAVGRGGAGSSVGVWMDKVVAMLELSWLCGDVNGVRVIGVYVSAGGPGDERQPAEGDREGVGHGRRGAGEGGECVTTGLDHTRGQALIR